MKLSTEKSSNGLHVWSAFLILIVMIALSAQSGCAPQDEAGGLSDQIEEIAVSDKPQDEPLYVEPQALEDPSDEAIDETNTVESIDIDIIEDYRPSFVHGDKGAAYQKYIMIHDTEGDGSPSSVIDYWDGNGNLVAAHFVIGKDGTIVQSVPLDKIAHHAGYGDNGHNAFYGIVEDGRDDMKGTTPIGSSMSDYGMNAWSIGIELVHVGASGSDYPEAQLEALDKVIAYIDSYYGFESEIIDHKSWRSGNSDTSAEFAKYMANYQKNRTHDWG